MWSLAVLYDAYVAALAHHAAAAAAADREILTSRVRGYFPFPTGPRGPLYHLFRDVHQSVSVSSSDGGRLPPIS